MSRGEKHSISRRDFVKSATVLIGGFIGTVIGAPAIVYLFSPASRAIQDSSWIDLGPLDEYPLGMPTLFQFTRTRTNGWERTGTPYGVFVIRPDASTVRVFSNICTHLGCRVNWRPDIRNYVSPCHDGHFDILGRNVSGPPPRPLDEFTTRIEDGRLSIRLPAFRRNS